VWLLSYSNAEFGEFMFSKTHRHLSECSSSLTSAEIEI
jgi:hypothetical protein